MIPPHVKIRIQDLCFSYHRTPVISQFSWDFSTHSITAVTGPSGTGKSTLLMTLNRLWEDIPRTAMTGTVHVRFTSGMKNIYAPSINLPWLRKQIGMVFQIPNPLPMSIWKNIGFPLKLSGETNKDIQMERIEIALKHAFLWEEVKDRLHDDARMLSGGQQQRLCIARTLVMNPEVLLLDEPTSSLDKRSASVIEDLLVELKTRQTIIMVSHYMDQVKRIADHIVEL